MNRYSLVSMHHAYDSVDNKLIDLKTIRGETVSVPQFLWSASVMNPGLPGSSVGRETYKSDHLGVACEKSNILSLKDCSVVVPATQKNVGRAVKVVSGGRLSIESVSERVSFTQVVMLKRQIYDDVKESQYTHGTNVPSVYRALADGMPFLKTLAFMNNHLPYGLTPQQFKLWYRGRTLNGWSYVFFAGNIIILLGDDFTFDSFALWSGQTPDGELVVEFFVYSVNPYIVKMMTLLG